VGRQRDGVATGAYGQVWTVPNLISFARLLGVPHGYVYLLEAGDSAYLDGGSPHVWENRGARRAKVLWVILG